MPARSLWIIFSVRSRCADARVTSHPTSVNSPALLRSLWQPVQYLLDELRLRGRASSARERARATGPPWRPMVHGALADALDCCARERDTVERAGAEKAM